MKTLVVIPAYNEEVNIEKVVKSITDYGFDQAIVQLKYVKEMASII